MEEYYKMLFTLFHENNPKSYQSDIQEYIVQLKKVVHTYPTLMCVAIFSAFRTEKESLYSLFPELYSHFGDQFKTTHMSETDKQYIINSFINKIEEIGKEFI